MKDLGWKAVLVLVLSVAVWWALYSAFPSAPPDAADSMVIVGMMLLVVLGTSSLLSRLRRRPRGASASVPDTAAAPAEAADSAVESAP
jgi:uncharacterized membrane-anchored protein